MRTRSVSVVALAALSMWCADVTEAQEMDLYGVVLGAQGGPVAYLGDPATGRVTGFRVGEMIGNRRLVAIAPDRVLLGDGSDTVEIRLGGGAPSSPTAATRPAASPPREGTSFGGTREPLPCPPLCVESPRFRRR